jgi:hypothetical protein
MKNKSAKKQSAKKSIWLASLWPTLSVLLAIVLAVFIIITILGFKFNLVLDVFRIFWPVFLAFIGIVYLIILLITKFPLGTLAVVLLALALVFLLASTQRNDIAQQLRLAIEKIVDVNYFVSFITTLAFVAALVGIFKKV